eukprot:SAG31_NODE_5658_length_2401_cov_1.434405_2_plen_158_part_00
MRRTVCSPCVQAEAELLAGPHGLLAQGGPLIWAQVGDFAERALWNEMRPSVVLLYILPYFPMKMKIVVSGSTALAMQIERLRQAAVLPQTTAQHEHMLHLLASRLALNGINTLKRCRLSEQHLVSRHFSSARMLCTMQVTTNKHAALNILQKKLQEF